MCSQCTDPFVRQTSGSSISFQRHSARQKERPQTKVEWLYKSAAKLKSALVASMLPTTENAQEVSDDEDAWASASPTPSKSKSKGLLDQLRVSRPLSAGGLPEICRTREQLRLLDRDGSCHQSRGHWAVNNITMRQGGNSYWYEQVQSLIASDAYHAFLDAGIFKQLFLLIGLFQSAIFMFAAMYLGMDDKCELGLKGSFVRAYMLSLETMVTIGYGVPDPYMNGCWQGALVLTSQSLAQLFLVAFVIGMIFQRLSRPQSRACTILFSKSAVINDIDGAHYFMFRVCDLRVHHTLLEAHVRVYCGHEHPTRGYELLPMRLEHPDDDLGGSLLLTIPFTVVHRIDAWSPLAPQCAHKLSAPSDDATSSASCTPVYATPSITLSEQHRREHSWRLQHEQLRTTAWPGSLQRHVDCETGNRQGCVCPTCGSSFGTARMLKLHCKYNARGDALNGQPEELRHKELTHEEMRRLSHEDPTREEIRAHLKNGYHEVVAIIEGIEPTTSCTVQARHSYLLGPKGLGKEKDFHWEMDFTECVTLPRDSTKGLVLDIANFHSLKPVAS